MSLFAPAHAAKTRRRIVRFVATVGVLALSGVAAAGGAALIARGPASDPQVVAPRIPVGAMQVLPVAGYEITRRFTGQIEAPARADLGFELGGRVERVLVEEGDLIAQGAVLARLDTSALIPERAALAAELAALEADAERARLTLARNDTLTERGFRSVADQDEARLTLIGTLARMDALSAQIAGVDVRLEKSVLTAPFDARVGVRLADAGQTLATGQPALVLFDSGPARLRVGLSPALAASMAVGDAVTVEVGDVEQGATVLHIRPDLDATTRSRAAVLVLPPETAPVLGDTATLVLTQQVAEPGFWAPLSALREGARGSWSVMALEAGEAGDRIVPAAVEVIHTDGARVFLRGQLPAGARIVAEAADRVTPGQLVTALAE
jgi:membrane fusion protein, multidrug efflux system